MQNKNQFHINRQRSRTKKNQLREGEKDLHHKLYIFGSVYDVDLKGCIQICCQECLSAFSKIYFHDNILYVLERVGWKAKR